MDSYRIISEQQAMESSAKYFDGDTLAAQVFVSKYALRDKDGNLLEETPDHMHVRLAKEFARIESKYSNGLSYEEIYNLLDHFKHIVPQGSPMMGIGNNHKLTSLSNCVVIDGPNDNVSSIIDTARDMANLYKRRCGVGFDVSKLRPEGAAVNNAAKTTSGAWSFCDLYSYITRLIGQAGRRGALMLTMDVAHPDIERFIEMKHDMTKVTGANVSVRLSDKFLQAVVADEDFTLQWPVDVDDPKITRKIKAKALWNKIVHSATTTAEPGLLLWSRCVKFMPASAYPGFTPTSTNPCGEQVLPPDDSCRLLSINLKSMVCNPFTAQAHVDYDRLIAVARAAMRLGDDLVDLEIEKLEQIAQTTNTEDERQLFVRMIEKAKLGRRCGISTHGEADMLACLGVRYDSEQALEVIEKVHEAIRNSTYLESCLLADQRGAFSMFNWELEKDNEFIKSLPDNLQQMIAQRGRRNVTILTNAPTGSVSILSQTSSGIEPVFRNKYVRRRKVSSDDVHARIDYVDALGDKWQNYDVYHHNVEQFLNSDNAREIIANDPVFVQSDEIDWRARVKFQGVIQKYVDNSISSTINLPKGTPVSVVSELYLDAWKHGLKGITVYVDGCRDGVLIEAPTAKEVPKQPSNFKRPDKLRCDVFKFTSDGKTVLVGTKDGIPYEVFVCDLPQKITKGKNVASLIKHKDKQNGSRYDLVTDDGTTIDNFTGMHMDTNSSVLTRMVSLALRSGTEVRFVVEQLGYEKSSDFHSSNKLIARALKTYIGDGEKVSTIKKCTQCGHEPLVYQEGCETCTSCGWSKCG